MENKNEVLESILGRFYRTKAVKVSDNGKFVDANLEILDERLDKNVSIIARKYEYKVNRHNIVSEQIYTMFTALSKFEVNELKGLSDTDIVNITIKHLQFVDYKLLETDMKRIWNSETKSKVITEFKTTPLDSLIFNSEVSADILGQQDVPSSVNEFIQWLNLNKYRILTDKQLYFLDNSHDILDDRNKLNYSKATPEYKENVSKNTYFYYQKIKEKITAEYEKHLRDSAKQQQKRQDKYFKKYLELYSNGQYEDCCVLLVNVATSSDYKVNSGILIKNKYEKIEDYLSDKLELKYMRQILTYAKTKDLSDIKQSTLFEVYKILSSEIQEEIKC